MLTCGKLREILASPSINDAMPVCIRTRMIDGTMQADDVNDIGVVNIGRRNWSKLILPGVADVELVPSLLISTLEPVSSAWEANKI
jgi:hypothetical protein